MKRYIFIIITIVAALLISCNIDATDGIYSEAAASTESTSVTTRSYLGQYNSAYYYLTDDGIFKIGQENALFADDPENTDAPIIRAASMNQTDGSLLILWQNKKPEDGAVIKYYAFDGTKYADPVVVEGTFTNLLANGLYYNSTGIFKYGGADSLVADIKAVMYTLISGDYAFFCIKDSSDYYKYYVIDASGAVKVNGIGSDTVYNTFIGFQAISDSDFVLLNYKNSNSKLEAYKMSATEIAADPYVTLKSSVPYAFSTQAMSFIYNDEIYFKCTSYFEKIKTDNETEQINTGFAANLRTAEITNILPTADDGIFVAGTKSSMLYRIDLINNSSSRITE